MKSLEWVFSGIGVVILAALLSPLRKYFVSWVDKLLRQMPFIEQRQIEAWVNDESYNYKPSPIEIVKKIKKLPPAQRKNVENSYIGLKVTWSVKFRTVFPEKDELVRLMLYHGSSYPHVFTKLFLNDYPQLKIYNESQVLWIAGEIVSLRGHDIVLENCRLRLFGDKV